MASSGILPVRPTWMWVVLKMQEQLPRNDSVRPPGMEEVLESSSLHGRCAGRTSFMEDKDIESDVTY